MRKEIGKRKMLKETYSQYNLQEVGGIGENYKLINNYNLSRKVN